MHHCNHPNLRYHCPIVVISVIVVIIIIIAIIVIVMVIKATCIMKGSGAHS